MKHWFEWLSLEKIVIKSSQVPFVHGAQTPSEPPAAALNDPTTQAIVSTSAIASGFVDQFSRVGDDHNYAVRRLVVLFMAVGIIARLIRYYLCFPLWDDESFLCVNFISRSYAELLQPLDYHQVAPIFFLWMERTSVKLFGFSEYALRLIPFVCSIGSLFVFRRVAERLLPGRAFVCAVGVFAVSYPGIRYSAEAKPYGIDLFVSLLMLWLVVEWQWRRNVWFLVILAMSMPVAMGVSYPAVFAAGGLSLVVGCLLLQKSATRIEWITWVIWNLSLVVSFLFWFLAVGRVQSGAEGEFMGEYWRLNFPPIDRPWMVPYWLLKTHASDFLAYPVGGPNWASSLSLIICIAGIWQWFRTKSMFLLGLLMVPASLHLIAAALQKYPYGGHVKFSQYLAPMICCLIGVGLIQLIDWSSKLFTLSKRALPCVCVILLLIGIGGIFRDLANPYKTRSDFRARSFAQSFWPGVHSVEEVACLKSDLDLDFVPKQHVELSWSAHYRCNRAIEFSRYPLRPFDFGRVSASRPLRCVLYRDARFELDQTRLEEWLKKMQVDYELIAHESLPFQRLAKDDRRLVTMEYIDSYKFIPREDSAKQLPPLARDSEIQKR